MYQTRLGLRRVMTEGDEADVLVAMNQQAWIEEHEDLCAQAAIVHEATVSIPSGGYARFPIPAEKTTQELDWPIGKNFVFLGALIWFFRFDSELAEDLIRQRMGRHPESLEKNLEAFRRGYRYAQAIHPEPFPTLPLRSKPRAHSAVRRRRDGPGRSGWRLQILFRLSHHASDACDGVTGAVSSRSLGARWCRSKTRSRRSTWPSAHPTPDNAP